MNVITEIDDDLIENARERTGLTLQETLEQGLRELIRKGVCRELARATPRTRSGGKTYEIDETLVQDTVDASGIPDARAAIEEALREFVRLEAQEALADLFGKIPLGSDYKAMRKG